MRGPCETGETLDYPSMVSVPLCTKLEMSDVNRELRFPLGILHCHSLHPPVRNKELRLSFLLAHSVAPFSWCHSKMLPNTGCDIARNFPLQQESVHFSLNFSAGSMQNKTFLRDVRIISKGPQGQPARHINTALDKGIRDLSKWPGRDVPQSRPDWWTQATSCHQT